mmetsp:Transcript_66843/g.196222  ORF Transcript_66843/g.196222 Transcript_66843/m.196222 type:complete len:211 (-) Transcript_66843:223-855(-)
MAAHDKHAARRPGPEERHPAVSSSARSLPAVHRDLRVSERRHSCLRPRRVPDALDVHAGGGLALRIFRRRRADGGRGPSRHLLDLRAGGLHELLGRGPQHRDGVGHHAGEDLARAAHPGGGQQPRHAGGHQHAVLQVGKQDGVPRGPRRRGSGRGRDRCRGVAEVPGGRPRRRRRLEHLAQVMARGGSVARPAILRGRRVSATGCSRYPG